ADARRIGREHARSRWRDIQLDGTGLVTQIFDSHLRAGFAGGGIRNDGDDLITRNIKQRGWNVVEQHAHAGKIRGDELLVGGELERSRIGGTDADAENRDDLTWSDGSAQVARVVYYAVARELEQWPSVLRDRKSLAEDEDLADAGDTGGRSGGVVYFSVAVDRGIRELDPARIGSRIPAARVRRCDVNDAGITIRRHEDAGLIERQRTARAGLRNGEGLA